MPTGKLVLTIFLLTVPTLAPAQQIAFAQYDATAPFLSAITLGADGALWFAGANEIGRITTAGVITEYPIAGITEASGVITAGPDGAIWFTENTTNQIGRITTAGTITEYPIPTANSAPWGITSGRDGALWFTESGANQLGRITTAGVISEYPIAFPSNYGLTRAIVTGPDGALWFTHGSNIVRITTPGSTIAYPISVGNEYFPAIAAGTDGALWYAGSCSIGRITTAGASSTFAIPGCTKHSDNDQGLTAGSGGDIWFTDRSLSGTSISRITTAGVITQYAIPNVTRGFNTVSGPGAITLGPDGELWFTDLNGIGEAFFVTANMTASPDTGFYQTIHTFTGSGYAPNETVRIFAQGVGSAVLATTTTDSTGSFTAAARVPQSPIGARVFVGVGQTSHKLGAASFSVTPNIVLNPSSGLPGSTVTAEAYGFPPLAAVRICWSASSTVISTATTDINGSIQGSAAVTFTVPDGAPLGQNRVIGVWDCTSATNCPNSGFGSFTVE